MVAQVGSHYLASDGDRDRAVRALKRGLVEGRLTYDSFVGRVGAALAARDSDELAGVLTGLPTRRRRFRLGWRSAARRLDRPAMKRLPLPSRQQPALLIGRAPDCDLILADAAVSRRHASLMLFGARWFVVDHGSTNGTWINDRQILGEATVRVGDRLRLGRTLFRLAPPTAQGCDEAARRRL